LLTKYNVSEAAIDAANAARGAKSSAAEIVIKMHQQRGVRRFEWEEKLAHNVARGFWCKVLYYKFARGAGSAGGGGYYFIGAARDVAIAISIFDRLQVAAGTMATRATEEYAERWRFAGISPRELTGDHSLKTYKLSWLTGFAAGIGAKLQTERKESEAAHGASTITALVVVKDAAIDARVAQEWPKLGKGRRFNSGTNSDGAEAGYKAGRNATIARGDLEG
jgi:hypothetical protein